MRLNIFTDDIPIPGPKDDANNSQLLSISEELEVADLQIGSRNTAGRGSKDNTRMNKVPFPGFSKKSKDKESKIAITSKNGMSTESSNSVGIINSQKQPLQPPNNKRDKFVARGSLQSSSNDFTDALERISPVSILKRKTSFIETANGTVLSSTAIITTTTTTTTLSTTVNMSGMELQPFSNGSISVDKNDDEKSPAPSLTSTATLVGNSLNNSIDATESIDSSPDNISVGTQRPSIPVDLISHNNNMQVSQV